MQFELPLGPILSPAEEEDRRRLELLPEEPANLFARGWEILMAHHAAVLRADAATVERCRKEMHDVGVKLHGGSIFGMACEGGGWWRLCRELAAPAGQVPMRGQPGEFLLVAAGCRVRVQFEHLCSHYCDGFGANAVDEGRPFISETGFRAFLTHRGALGVGADEFARLSIEGYFQDELTGRLVPIQRSGRYAEVVAARIAADPALAPGGWLAQALARTPPPPLPLAPAPLPRKPRRVRPARPTLHHAA